MSTHLNVLFDSSLAEDFSLVHFQVGSEGRDERAYQKPIRLLRSVFSLIYVLLKLRPDVVHINTSLNVKAFWRDAVYIVVAKLLACSIVNQIHGGLSVAEFCQGRPIRSWVFAWTNSLADTVVVLWKARGDEYCENANIKRLEVIPNAIDLTAFEDDPPKEFGKPLLNLVYIGRLSERKGVYDCIRAVEILSSDMGMDGVHLTVAGSGPDEDKLRQHVCDLAVSNKVRFLGPIFGPDKGRFWRDADIFVFPTYTGEGLPYTILESIASGTPIITTRTAGIPDVVQAGVQAVFVNPRDPRNIAEVVSALYKDKEALPRMSKACLVRAKNYSVDNLAVRFRELYKALCAN
ncbi:MAG: glycosyltransferase family 1 protein [Lysobacterales bacterium]|nr:MAG: glycosyltransferase family 1 protein [Xanthomonadales bacterium]